MIKSEDTKARLTAAVTALCEEDGFKRWLRLRATTLGRYSLFNQLLIAVQYPEASRVAGYKAWQQQGRQVMKGEQGIHILAPIKRHLTVKDETTGEESRLTHIVGFSTAVVFDVLQTRGPALPKYNINPTGSSAAHQEAMLLALAATRNLEVVTEDTGSADGYYSPSEKKIGLSTRLDPNGRVHTLIHELVHSLGVGYQEFGRQAAELITETAAVIVCAELGLDSIESSSFYLAAWGDGNPDEALKHLAAADQLARTLEEALGLNQKGGEASRIAS
jgi:antirestriction protein ArdC